MYDLLLQGGRVIDPAQNLDGAYDVAIQDGAIGRVAQGIPPQEARRTINVAGKLVTPGLIDAHCHIFHSVTRMSENPDLVGVYAGVTTLVDGGSGGAATFAAFPRYVIPASKTEILCYLNISRNGLLYIPEVRDEVDLDQKAALETVEQHRPHILGMKVRMVSPALQSLGVELARKAKEVAAEAGIKLMVHIGDQNVPHGKSPVVIRELLRILEPGDVLTHLFTGHPGGVLDSNGKLVPEAKEARDRGVVLDAAMGRYNLSFDVGRRVLDQGLVPDCISTDITIPGRQHAVHSMTEVLTRFLAMGVPLQQVIAMATINPARAIGQDHRLGTLKPGYQADVSVLEIREGRWQVYDSHGVALPTEQAVVPVLTVKRGEVFSAEWGPRPWGWLPDPA